MTSPHTDGPPARHLVDHLDHVDGLDHADGVTRDVAVAAREPESWLAERHQLLVRIETMQVIEQAKGVLMGHYRVDAPAAFALLRRWSQNHNIKVRAISEVLVESVADDVAGRAGPAGLLVSVIDRLNGAEPFPTPWS